MEVKDLTGEHILTGVDMENEDIEEYGGIFADCQVINFVLDGKTLSAIEDPTDGYRSSMKDLKEAYKNPSAADSFRRSIFLISISPFFVKNMFPECRVVGKIRDGQPDVIEFIDIVTGREVLSVGTDTTDDYYPSFVAEFLPENMTINWGTKRNGRMLRLS
jgi:hypothetical protein